MPETGYSQAAKVNRGALVQLVPDIVGVVPNIVTFQYNPEKITRGVEPWNPFDVDQTKRGAQAPTVHPYDPEETFSFTLEFDAAMHWRTATRSRSRPASPAVSPR